MTTLQKLFVRVHSRYTRSPHVEDLTAFARWSVAREYPKRYVQRLVFCVMRSLERSGRSSGSRWTGDALDRAFRRVRHREMYPAPSAATVTRIFAHQRGLFARIPVLLLRVSLDHDPTRHLGSTGLFSQ